jgi:hypothetical protein
MLVKKKRKKPVYREHQEQVAFFDWLDRDPTMKKVREVTFAIPNARRTSWFMGKTLKREGVRAGVPDVFMAWPSHGYYGMFIEHKASKGRLSPAQEKRIASFIEAGYKCVVSYSASQSIEATISYLFNPNGYSELCSAALSRFGGVYATITTDNENEASL